MAFAGTSLADTGAAIDAQIDSALAQLMEASEAASALAERAVGSLVFPEIVDGGLIVGGESGEGALRQAGRTTGYFNILAASFGLQIGAKSYSQASFFMTEEAHQYLARGEGLELGIDLGIAIADEGFGAAAATSTLEDPIIAFTFGEQGLLVGGKREGSKITQIER